MSEEELRKLVELDLEDIRKTVNGLVRAMDSRPETDTETVRIGAVLMSMLAYIPVRSHALVAAVAMEMLRSEREAKKK